MDFLIDSTLILYADILFRRSVLDRLLQTEGDLILAIDPAIPSRRRQGKGRVVEAVSFQHETAKQASRVIKRLSRNLPRSQQDGEFIGVGLIRKGAIERVKTLLRKLDADPSNTRSDLLALFQAWVDGGEKLYGMVVSSEEWMDVDTFEDYRDAWSRVES
jgi:phosphoenolpyruvate phosphomutase